MNSEEYSELERRFDDRYKKLSDCDRDMDDVKKEHNELLVLVTGIKTTLDSTVWLQKSILGAVIVAIVGAVFYVITKGG